MDLPLDTEYRTWHYGDGKRNEESGGTRRSERMVERERDSFFSVKRKNLIYCWLSVGL